MSRIASSILALAAATCFDTAMAQEKIDLGKREFETNCAICHGINAKGSGLFTAHLKPIPSDLTTLSKRNNGVFPINEVYEVIDGRKQVGAHGDRTMPIWGRRYNVAAAEHYVDVPYDPESYVRNRILVLVDYLYRVQEK